MRKYTLVLATAAGTSPSPSPHAPRRRPRSDGDIVVTATDDSCDVSATTGTTGSSTFQVTNNGSKVTEFYVFAEGDRAMGEVENIGPGLTRQLIVSLPRGCDLSTRVQAGHGPEPASVRTSSSRVIRRRPPTRAASSPEAADGYRRYIRSQIVALQGHRSSVRRRRPVRSTSTRRRHSSRSHVPTTSASNPKPRELSAELDPKLDLREADLEPGQGLDGIPPPREGFCGVTGLQPDTNAVADQLLEDIQYLADQLNAEDYTIDPTKIAGDAQGLLDEISTSKITGEEDIFLAHRPVGFPGQRRRLASGDRGTEPDSAGT